MPPRAKAKEADTFEVPTPGEWVQVAPGHYQWREGTAADLHEEHEPHVIHRTATGWTSEHGTWTFTGLPTMPEGGTEGMSMLSVDDLDRQIADLQAQRVRAAVAQQA